MYLKILYIILHCNLCKLISVVLTVNMSQRVFVMAEKKDKNICLTESTDLLAVVSSVMQVIASSPWASPYSKIALPVSKSQIFII